MADLTWTIVREVGAPVQAVRPENLCPYPWGPGVALLDPFSADGLPVELYTADGVKEIRLNPLPTVGANTYTITRTDATTDVIRTDDLLGLSMRGDNFITISRNLDATGRRRFVLLVLRWNLLRSIVRS